jgi:ribosomal protein S18 acetylase RimI-like enzyme
MIPVMLGIIGSVTMPELAASEQVIPAMAIQYLHPAAIAIFVGAMLAAIMSSADSALLANASVLARNVLPLVVRNPSDRLTLIVAKWAIPVSGLVAIVVAMKIQVVFDLMVNANILGLAAMIVPFILGVWWRKANRTGALSAMAAGIIAWLATLYLAPELPADFIGLGACLVTMLVVTPLTQRFDPPRELRDGDGNSVDSGNRLGILPLFKRGSKVMKIERAGLEQVKQVAPLFDRYRQFYEQPTDEPRCGEYLEQRLSNDESIVFLATEDTGQAIGFTQLYATFCSVDLITRLVLYDLYVEENVRRRGVAKALMDEALRFARENGYERLTLETAVDNFPGQKLYEKEGWKKDNEFYTYHLSVS